MSVKLENGEFVFTPVEQLYDNGTLNTNYDQVNLVTWDNCGLCDTITMSVDATDLLEYITELRYSEREKLGLIEIDQFIEDASKAHIQEAHPEIRLDDDSV